ncbi:MAG: HD domain-containing protein [Oscillospiraceae bacterium]
MNLQQIETIAVAELGGRASHPYKETGNKLHHGKRTAVLVKTLCAELNYTGETDTLTVAAWFHDICNGGDRHEEHEALGAARTAELIAPFCTPEECDTICALIARHDSRSAPDLPLELKILQDADFLDHFGAFEIWCTFHYALKEDWSMERTASEILAERARKYEKQRNELHFNYSRNIYEEKHVFVQAFAERMAREAAGELA